MRERTTRPTEGAGSSMPTSKEESSKKARRPHSLAVVLALIVLLVPLNVGLCFLLQPYGSQSELVWSEYRATPNINTLFVGTSLCEHGLNPVAFDEELGSHSFNMAIPNLSFRECLTAIKTAAKERELKRVVAFVGFATMTPGPSFESAVAFTQAKCSGEPPQQAVADMFGLFTDDYYFKRPGSVVGLFPWSFSNVGMSLSAIKTNVYNRLNRSVVDATRHSPILGDTWRYYGQGFGTYNDAIDGNTKHADKNKEEQSFLPHNMEGLRQVCSYCREQGIDMYVVGAPFMPSAVVEFGESYPAQMQTLKDLVESEGAHYFDLNMAHNDVYEPQLAYYHDDTQHLSYDGSVVASKAAARTIARIEAGEDVSGEFFDYTEDGQRAWLETIDYVDSVDYTWKTSPNGAVVEAYAVTSPSTPVEYRMEMLDANGKWIEVRGWDANPTFELPSGSSKEHKIRLYAHATNGRQDKDRRVEGLLAF